MSYTHNFLVSTKDYEGIYKRLLHPFKLHKRTYIYTENYTPAAHMIKHIFSLDKARFLLQYWTCDNNQLMYGYIDLLNSLSSIVLYRLR